MRQAVDAQRSWNYQTLLIVLAAILVVGTIIWQAFATNGNPDPTAQGLNQTSVIVETGILVFREGLEAILVLAAITASLLRQPDNNHWRPIAAGSGVAFVASIATWFIVVAIISAINAPALDIQAATGLLAIVVLLIIMNWFFHKIYWAGWIAHHNRRRRQIMETATDRKAATLFGLGLLGFSAVYREGFEIVLFLQSLRLRSSSEAILAGVLIGLGLSGIVAVLTFAAQRRLPYKRMLVLTGVLLAGVLVVMVGESVQEMQLAGWISTTSVGLPLPNWVGVWFATFPNAEGLTAQFIAAALVLGSYVAARWRVIRPQQALATSPEL
jgi:high-affinity iron transporter